MGVQGGKCNDRCKNHVRMMGRSGEVKRERYQGIVFVFAVVLLSFSRPEPWNLRGERWSNIIVSLAGANACASVASKFAANGQCANSPTLLLP